MPASRLTVPIFTSLMPLLFIGSSFAQTADVDLGKARIIVVKIPAGTFRMGSEQIIHAGDDWKPCPGCPEVERPVHQVTISKNFWMGQFDVTQKQWEDVMSNNSGTDGTFSQTR